MSNIGCNTDGIINWKNDYAFEIDITLPLRKAGIDSITGDENCLRIYFVNETALSIDFPCNSDNLLKVIERDLLRWDGYYEGYGLPGYVIERIVNHLKENIADIKKTIKSARNS